MDDLEYLVNKLAEFSDNLNLMIDSCPGLVRQHSQLVNAREQLQNIKAVYGEMLGNEIDINSLIIGASWFEEIASSLLNDDNFLIDLEWGRDLTLNQQLKKIDESLKLPLEFSNEQLLRQQLQQIKYAQEKIRQIQIKLDQSIETFLKGDDEAEIIKKLIYLIEESVFTLEGYNENEELLISYAGQVIALKSILSRDCEFLKRWCETLSGQANNLIRQAEQYIKQLEEQHRRDLEDKRQHQAEQNKTKQKSALQQKEKPSKRGTQKKRRSSVGWILILSTIIIGIFGYAGWKTGLQLSQIRQIIANFGIPLNTGDRKLNTPSEQTTQSTPETQPVVQPTSEKDVALANWETAQKLAMESAVMTQNPPHPLEVWQNSQAKWQQAVHLLESIPENHSLFPQAQDKVSAYKTNYTAINNRIITEQKAAANLENAQKLALESATLIQTPSYPPEVLQEAKAKLQEAIQLLEKIPAGSYASVAAKENLPIYRNKYTELKQK